MTDNDEGDGSISARNRFGLEMNYETQGTSDDDTTSKRIDTPLHHINHISTIGSSSSSSSSCCNATTTTTTVHSDQITSDTSEKSLSILTGSISNHHRLRNNNEIQHNDGTATTAETITDKDKWQTLASVAGNVLEWFDFAIFGYFSDVLGEVFFPPISSSSSSSSITDDDNNSSTSSTKQQTMESFFVYGLAFLMRPIGGLIFGYIGDYYGRKKALVISIFTMAFPTFIMGMLPGYYSVGVWAIVFLVIVRLLQGLSVGGQLISSLVYLLENKNPDHWGFYGSFTMAAAIFGSLLGGVTSFVLRAVLSHEQLVAWGWRIPFLCGIFVSIFGFYLRNHGSDHDGYRAPRQRKEEEEDDDDNNNSRNIKGHDVKNEIYLMDPKYYNPLRDAFRRENLRSLLAASLVPMLWSSSFYLSFVWMPIFMAELSDNPIPGAFLINAVSLFLSVCLVFPIAGSLSDRYGRVRIMTIGGIMLATLSPLLVITIGRGKIALAFLSQCIFGSSISLFTAPMCAWLVEAFEPNARLTSVAVGYNIAQALAGGITPFLATIISNDVGQKWPGWIISVLATISLVGLLLIAPKKQPPSDTFYSANTVGIAIRISDDGMQH